MSLDNSRYTRDIRQCPTVPITQRIIPAFLPLGIKASCVCPTGIILRRTGPSWPPPCAACWSSWHGHAYPHPVAQRLADPQSQSLKDPPDEICRAQTATAMDSPR